MATSDAQLCSMALLRVGQRQTIDSLNGPSAEARACKALYADARDALLAMHPWRFATKRAVLAELEDDERSGWEYTYALPTDCITPRSLWAGDRAPALSGKYPFELEWGANDTPVLLADQEDAELVYTARITVVPRFPPLFVEALAWKLAADLALSLPVKPGVAKVMEEKFQRALAQAVAADGNQVQEDAQPESEFVRGR